MRILVVTDVLWRNDNGVGNSYSNIFAGIPDITIANVCCQAGKSDNTVSQSCFQMSESRLIRNLFNRTVKTGVIEKKNDDVGKTGEQSTSGFLNIIKRSRLQIFFWLRDLIWKFGRWKSNELIKFINDFKPDLVFAQLQDKKYLNNIACFVSEYLGVPLVVYAWDDVYSLKQFSLSPLFWVDRFMQRASIRKLVDRASIMYTISQEQKEEYARILKVHTELLYKGYEFNRDPYIKRADKPVRMLYTGNLYSGRYKTLLQICRLLEKYNQEKYQVQLDIYSATPLSKSEISALNIENTSLFKGKISEKDVQEKQREADILLHIEPLTLKGSLLCRLSFSTKLVDYFHNGKCIFAVGADRCSSIRYLQRNNAAVVAKSIQDTEIKLKELLRDSKTIEQYGHRAWKCGKRNHNIADIQERLLESFKEIMK